MLCERILEWLRRFLKWLWDLLRGDNGVPPKTNSLMFVEPKEHYLEYGSCLMRSIVAGSSKPEYEVQEIRGGDASSGVITSAIAVMNPAFFFGLGHGAPCAFTVECTELFISVMSGSHAACDLNRNLDLMAGMVVHLNSCLTGQELGQALVDHGARAYIGSREPFWFYIAGDPCESRAEQAVFLCEYQVEVTLMAGLSVEQAVRDSQKRYDEEIEYWTVGGGRIHPNAASIVRALQIDKDIQVQLGDGKATVCTPDLPVEWSVTGLTMGMAPLLAVGAVISSEEIDKFLKWIGWIPA